MQAGNNNTQQQPNAPVAVAQFVTPRVSQAQGMALGSQNTVSFQTTPGQTAAAGGRVLFDEQSKGAVQNAITRSITTKTAEEKKKEFTWQNGYGAKDKDKFKEELLAYSPDIKVCAFVQKDSTIVKVVHGLCKYFGSSAREYAGKVLGRMGEWEEDVSPLLLRMPDQAAWDWNRMNVCTDAVAWANHVNTNEESIKPWTAPTAMVTSMELPRMIYVPAEVAQFLVSGERSAFEMFKFVSELASRDDAVVTGEQCELLKNWAIAVGQENGMALSIMPVTNSSPQFMKWTNEHMKTYLESPVKTAPVQQVAQSAPVGATEAVLQSVTEVLKNITEKHGMPKAEAGPTSVVGKGLSEYQMAALCGFCCITDPNEKPGLYSLLPTCTELDDVRKNVMRMLQEWGVNNRREIDKGIYLTDEVIKCVMKVNPNPNKMVATSEPSDRIISNLVLLPRRPDQIQKMIEKDRIARETEGKNTAAELEKFHKNDVRAPPTTYERLKKNITTTEGLLTVLYGQKCGLVKGLHSIFKQLDTAEANVLHEKYTPELCKQITWAVYDSCRSYFAVTLMPQDLLGSKPVRFPVCSLVDIVADVGFQRPVYRSTFPESWKEKTTYNPPGGQLSTPAGKGGQVPDITATYTPKVNAFQAAFQGTPNSVAQAANGVEQLHPKIKAFMAEYHKLHNGAVYMPQLMELANVRWSDLPCLDGHWNSKDRQCKTCWPHMLGKCAFGEKCNHFKRHVPGANVPDKYAEDVIKVIGPGVKAMVDGKLALQKSKRARSG